MQIIPASQDASFRRYFRLMQADKSYILMDASCQKNTLAPFIKISHLLRHADVHTPKIVHEDTQNGILVLEDFGSTHLLDKLNHNNFTNYYKQAIDVIVKMQQIDPASLPPYDKTFLHREMALMQEWYLERNLCLTLHADEQKMLDATLDAIGEKVLQQPQNKFVHRDFHSRNIMLTPQNDLGIIDYQDAMSGALTYDLVSLLKDCYIAFDPKEITKLALYFKECMGLDVDDALFLEWFDFTGMQRHIKVLGIFSRLALRDGKESYLQDIPLTRRYLIEAAKKYPQTRQLATFLEQRA